MDIRHGECIELLKTIPDKSVDLFICDLPYGETNCKWDTKIDMADFWKEFKRVRKSKRTACIHFCSTKFGYSLIKSNEGMFKMDMVWKKRNKTGGLQSRHRPMRNHEMVYFFYEQAPKYNRDKYHKRIVAQPKVNKEDKKNDDIAILGVVEEPTDVYGETKKKRKARRKKGDSNFEPVNPASVVEEKDVWGQTKFKDGGDCGRLNKDGTYKLGYEPTNPSSVVEETESIYTKEHLDNNRAGSGTNTKTDIYTKDAIKKYKEQNGVGFTPPTPASVLEEDEYIIPAEDEPKSMYESTKVFIGKRNHQTEKPQDILEFFLKYWTDEDDVVLDPTMGSGSTGVACKKLNRKFIGFELDEKIFKVAEKRINK